LNFGPTWPEVVLHLLGLEKIGDIITHGAIMRSKIISCA